jgi:hypothetical protein
MGIVKYQQSKNAATDILAIGETKACLLIADQAAPAIAYTLYKILKKQFFYTA